MWALPLPEVLNLSGTATQTVNANLLSASVTFYGPTIRTADNLISNPYCASDASNWTPIGGTGSRGALSDPYARPYGFKMDVETTDENLQVFVWAGDVVVGTKYSACLTVSFPSIPTGGNMNLAIFWMDSGYAGVGTSQADYAVPAAGEPFEYRITGTAPTGAVYASVRWYVWKFPTAGDTYTTMARLAHGDVPNIGYADGSTTDWWWDGSTGTSVSYGAREMMGVAVPRLAGATTLYQPTVAPGAVSVAPDLLTASPTFYQPSSVPGAVAVAADLSTVAATLYQPAVTPGAVTAVAPLLSGAVTAYQPSVTPGAVSVGGLLLSLAVHVYAPTEVAQPGSGTCTWDGTAAWDDASSWDCAQLVAGASPLTSAPTLYEPGVATATSGIAALLLSLTVHVFTPADVAQPGSGFCTWDGTAAWDDANASWDCAQIVTAATPLTSSPTLYPPSLPVVVELARLDVGTTVYAPGVVANVAPTRIDAPVTVYSPAVTSVAHVDADLLGAVTALFDPDVTTTAAAAAQLLTVAATVYTPTVMPGPATVVAQLLVASIALYIPAVIDLTQAATDAVSRVGSLRTRHTVGVAHARHPTRRPRAAHRAGAPA